MVAILAAPKLDLYNQKAVRSGESLSILLVTALLYLAAVRTDSHIWYS